MNAKRKEYAIRLKKARKAKDKDEFKKIRDEMVAAGLIAKKRKKGSKTTSTKSKKKKPPPSLLDPVDFLIGLESKKTQFNTASLVPLQSSNSPALRKIDSIEKQKYLQEMAREESLRPILHAHSDDTNYEKTALGLFATLPAKDHGPDF